MPRCSGPLRAQCRSVEFLLRAHAARNPAAPPRSRCLGAEAKAVIQAVSRAKHQIGGGQMNELTDRMQRGAEIAASGAALAADYFKRRSFLESGSKLAPIDLLTEADRVVEEHVKADLANAFPDDGFWGEESVGAAATSLSVADPIDGTSNSMEGLPLGGTSLAYVEYGEVLLGFLVSTQRDLIYQAARGGGATCNGLPIVTSYPLARCAAGLGCRGNAVVRSGRGDCDHCKHGQLRNDPRWKQAVRDDLRG